ncbi:Ogfr [Symbiodinium sp. CCMP2592]|nr:Ogfr [Symbiodinium sp. CCMP2592]CAE7258191.1 Ogfr [Symbiodinium sp. CCMP2592]
MVYASYSDLVQKHGEAHAKQLAEEKHQKQATEGDAEPGFPWYMPHPDFPQSQPHTQYLVWDGASLQTANVDTNTSPDTAVELPPAEGKGKGANRKGGRKGSAKAKPGNNGGKGANNGGVTKNTLEALAGPEAATQDWDNASVADSQAGKPKKVQTKAQKAKSKLRDCTTISVEGSVWLRKLNDLNEDDLKEIGLPAELRKAYMSAISEHLAAVATASKAIEDLLVKDTKDEEALGQTISVLDKTVNAYHSFITKTIKPQFAEAKAPGKSKKKGMDTGLPSNLLTNLVSMIAKGDRDISFSTARECAEAACQDLQNQGVLPSGALHRLSQAGSSGAHGSNVERDVLRQLKSKVPVDAVNVPVMLKVAGRKTCTTRTFDVILPHRLLPWLLQGRTREQRENLIGTPADIAEYWSHTQGQPGHPATLSGDGVNLGEFLPIGLHGDEFRFTQAGEKLMAVTMNFVVAGDRLRFPLFLIRCVSWMQI